MKVSRPTPALLFAMSLLLTGCAGPEFICVRNPIRIELSPAQRIKDRMTLVSISRSGRVTIRLETLGLADARVGEEFKTRSGKPYDGKLVSADLSSGKVVVEEYEFAMEPMKRR